MPATSPDLFAKPTPGVASASNLAARSRPGPVSRYGHARVARGRARAGADDPHLDAVSTLGVDLAICWLPTMSQMPERSVESEPRSSLELALERVGDRWSLLLVDALLAGPRRFNELQESVSGIAPNILSDRLRRLEREGVLVGRPYSDRPPRMEYTLTAAGHDLAGALRLLADWGGRRSDQADPMRHSLCGTPLEARWYCPTCTVVVEDRAADEARLV
jgi:DNA-binding HxlR family transcriptional regulator